MKSKLQHYKKLSFLKFSVSNSQNKRSKRIEEWRRWWVVWSSLGNHPTQNLEFQLFAAPPLMGPHPLPQKWSELFYFLWVWFFHFICLNHFDLNDSKLHQFQLTKLPASGGRYYELVFSMVVFKVLSFCAADDFVVCITQSASHPMMRNRNSPKFGDSSEKLRRVSPKSSMQLI